MKLLRNIALAVLVLLVLIGACSLFLPNAFSVQRSAVIAADAGSLYARFATPRSWARWSAWTTAADPTLVYRYEGPDSGVGAVMAWSAKKMGNGRLTIVRAEPPREVGYDLQIEGSDMRVHGRITLEPAEGGTRVTWNDAGDFGRNPLMRWFRFMMDGALGSAYEKSFANLRAETRAR